METSEFEIKEDIKAFFMSTDQVPAGIPALFEDLRKRSMVSKAGIFTV